MEGGKGGNSYWPGFVDALTNVVIAMIFVIVVLAIALSFAAQLMGKKIAQEYIDKAKVAAATGDVPPPAAVPITPVAESIRSGRTVIAVTATSPASAVPAGGVLKSARNVLELQFAVGALALDDAAAKALNTALAAEPKTLRVLVEASGPQMSLSANQRAAYSRVMLVRNALLAQGFAAERIDTRINTKTEAPMAAVNISFVEGL